MTGFTIRNAKGVTKGVAGIYVYGSTDCNISNNLITNIWTTDIWREVYGIYLASQVKWNNFFNTYIFNLNAGRDAYGIYTWDFRDLFSNTYVFNINGRVQRLMPWTGLGLVSSIGIAIAAVIAIRRRRREPSSTIQKGNAPTFATWIGVKFTNLSYTQCSMVTAEKGLETIVV